MWAGGIPARPHQGVKPMKLHPQAFMSYSANHCSLLSRSDGRTHLRIPASFIARHLAGESLEAIFPSEVIEILRQHELVESCEDLPRRHSPTWPEAWGELSRAGNLAKSNARYVTDVIRAAELEHEVAADPAAPATFSSWCVPDVHRLNDPDDLGVSLARTLLSRRTSRTFTTDVPVDAKQLETILAWTCRPTRLVAGGPFGALPFYTSPHAGARNDIECYVVIRQSLGPVPTGVFHYNPLMHALERIGDCPNQAVTYSMVLNVQVAATAPLLAVLTSRTDRIAAKYRDARAERLVFLNAGHRAQTIVLCATALGLATYQSAAFDDALVRAELKLADMEQPTYVMAFGTADPHDPYRLSDATEKPTIEIRTFGQ
jgi:SagB-type dehydrogenase family enzyme